MMPTNDPRTASDHVRYVRDHRLDARAPSWQNIRRWRYTRLADALARVRKLQDAYPGGLAVLRLEVRVLVVVEDWAPVRTLRPASANRRGKGGAR